MNYRVNNKRDIGRGLTDESPTANGNDTLYNHRGPTDPGMRLRVTAPAERAQTTASINKYDWERTLSWSRQLYTRIGALNGALMQKALYVVGDAWTPEYKGENEAWGKRAAEMLEAWYPVADLRGEPYDFQTGLYLTSLALDRCGDTAMVTTRDSSGEPRLQFLPSHRITTRYGTMGQDYTGFGVVPDGRFAGSRIYNGVIFDKSGRVVGYNVLGDYPIDDQQLPISSCQLLYEPDWTDQGRGIPRLATSLTDWMDYEDIHHFLKRQVKQDSAQGILHYNERGAADTTRNWIEDKSAGASNTDVKIERLEGNEIMYFRAMGGGKIEPYKSDRPSANVDVYMQRIIRGCLQSAGWFYELYDPSQIGGANTRMIQDMARMSIWWRQKNIKKRALRGALYALSTWMDLGYLDRNDVDWHKWAFTLPAEITVDARYDDQTWMDRIKMAAGTYEEYFGERGGQWRRQIRQRIIEQKFIAEECKLAGVDQSQVQMLTPNGNPSGGAPGSAPFGGAKSPEDELDKAA